MNRSRDKNHEMGARLGLVLLLLSALFYGFLYDGRYLIYRAPTKSPAPPTEKDVPVEISVESATYGDNCGATHGNATDDVVLICNGEADCSYKVDVERLGDPTPKCRKDFSISYSCLPDAKVVRKELPPEADLGSVLELRCGSPRTELAENVKPWRREIPKPTAPPQSGLYIRSATYGVNCGVAEGNSTKDLAASCNGKAHCAYSVSVDHLGDPAPKCVKNFIASYSCMPDPVILHQELPAEAGFGSVLTLRCSLTLPTSSQ